MLDKFETPPPQPDIVSVLTALLAPIAARQKRLEKRLIRMEARLCQLMRDQGSSIYPPDWEPDHE